VQDSIASIFASRSLRASCVRFSQNSIDAVVVFDGEPVLGRNVSIPKKSAFNIELGGPGGVEGP
jgi:hypothetical protein